MKKTILVLVISFIALSLSAQKKDSIPAVQKEPTPAEKILSRNDLEAFIKYMRENISVAAYENMKPTEVVNFLWQWYIAEYNKQKPKK